MKMLVSFVRARVLLGALALALVASSALQAGTAFSKIVVFGDSLNDRGNMVQFTAGAFPAPPVYAYGRQTNGQVWVEYFADRLGMADQIVNYAVVGAMTKPTTAVPTGNVWDDTFTGLEGTDVISQVSDYLADSKGHADPAALYILEGGANDFTRVSDPTTIIANLTQCLVTLESRGARHIVLVNLPDIGKTPRVFLAEQFGFIPPGTGAYLTGACAQFNQALAAIATSATTPEVTLTIADIYGFMGTVASNGPAYGFADVQTPYLMTGMPIAANPSTWLFWDDLHPTTRGHEVFAEQAFATLLNSYSPANTKASAQAAVNSLRGTLKPKK